jgi:hypothetical protein
MRFVRFEPGEYRGSMQPVLGLGTFSMCFTPRYIDIMARLTELAIRVGPRVRIRLAPPVSRCEPDFVIAEAEDIFGDGVNV